MKNIVNTKRIEAHMKEKELTKIKFCKKCGISTATLSAVLTGKNISVSTLKKIANGMETNILSLLKED